MTGDWPGHVGILTTGTTYKYSCRWRGGPRESEAAATKLGLMLAQFLVPKPYLSRQDSSCLPADYSKELAESFGCWGAPSI